MNQQRKTTSGEVFTVYYTDVQRVHNFMESLRQVVGLSERESKSAGFQFAVELYIDEASKQSSQPGTQLNTDIASIKERAICLLEEAL